MRRRIVWLWLAGAGTVAGAAVAQTPVAPRPAATPQPTPAATPTPAAPVPAPVAQPPASDPATTAATAAATTGDGLDDPLGDAEEVVVTGQRPRGSAIGDIPPEVTLGPADIRSYGVGSVRDLIAELQPLTQSGGGDGPPVFLLNGRRISGLQEIREVPTEAIERVDILPEEVALKYGYRPDQKVVNFVLRNRFHAATAEARDTYATDGGRNATNAELDLLNIRRDTRQNIHVQHEQNGELLESERNIVPRPSEGVGAGFDQRPYRTLPEATSAARQQASVNAVYARPILGVAATLNGRIELTSTQRKQGAPIVALQVPATTPFAQGGAAAVVGRQLTDGFDPLAQRSEVIDAHLGATVNGDIGQQWRWNVIGSYDRTATDTYTETGVAAAAIQARLAAGDPAVDPRGTLDPALFGAAAANRARSVVNDGGVNALLTGTAFRLPAGGATASLRVRGNTTDLSSRTFRPAIGIAANDLSRDAANGQLNLDLPIASRTKNVLPFLGTLSINGNVAVERLSDFNQLNTYGYGLNWRPLAGVRVIASVTDDDNAPTVRQLGDAQVVTPNVRVFDFARGVTSTVTVVTGGNPALPGSNRHQDKVGLTLNPWSRTNLTLSATYFRNRVTDPTVGFPAPTPVIERAFPGRFTRDAAGVLTRLDRRPISFARREQSQLRWGFEFFQPLKSRLQKDLAAYRAGTGPNPFAGLREVFGRRSAEDRDRGDTARERPERSDANGSGKGETAADRTSAGADPADGGAAGDRASRGGGGGGGGSRGGGGGRINLAVFHTWRFTDEVLVTDGGPRLNLLDGDAINANGGQPRHEVQAQAGYSNNGVIARVSANYQAATRVNGLSSADDLRFDSLATVDLRLALDFSARLDWLRAHPWLRGTRVTLTVDNLFNTRQRVRDAGGATPVAYQSAYLDPLGRTVALTVRKLFF